MAEICTKPASQLYRDNWDRIFAPKTVVSVAEALQICGYEVQIDDSMPPNEIHLHHPNGRIDKIVNIGTEANG